MEEGGNVTYKLGYEVYEVKDRSKTGVVIGYKTSEGVEEDAHFDDMILAVGEQYGHRSESRN